MRYLTSKIPLIEWLFKKETKTKDKAELLIFITPRGLLKIKAADGSPTARRIENKFDDKDSKEHIQR